MKEQQRYLQNPRDFVWAPGAEGRTSSKDLVRQLLPYQTVWQHCTTMDHVRRATTIERALLLGRCESIGMLEPEARALWLQSTES
jgi:hypothetical protein